MCKFPARSGGRKPEGFTLLEVLVSLTVLAIGLMASSLLMTNSYKYSVRSRYMSEAAQLASEKLEDLCRFPTTDEHVTVMSGDNECGLTGINCEGSITTDAAAQQITTGGSTYTVNYWDSVFMSTADGVLKETYQTVTGSSPQYATLTFSPNGTIPAITTATTAPTAGETFDRRWMIEQDQPVTGVRRITVLVTLKDYSIGASTGSTTTPASAVTFQMSTVRP
jgi:prepilin-type N-terminal cleavage/methylation domain-containing protein